MWAPWAIVEVVLLPMASTPTEVWWSGTALLPASGTIKPFGGHIGRYEKSGHLGQSDLFCRHQRECPWRCGGWTQWRSWVVQSLSVDIGRHGRSGHLGRQRCLL